MKQVKRLTALLLTVVLLAMTPLTALALGPSGYVPTKAITYSKSDGKWVKESERTFSYKSDGRIAKTTYKYLYDGGSSGWTKYTWSGNHIKKVTTSSGGGWSYKYKGNKLLSYKSLSGDKATYKITWKGKKGTYKKGKEKMTLTVNGKGQVVKEVYAYDGGTNTTTYKYYGNGNRKSYTYKEKSYTYTVKYNSKGWVTSEKETGEYSYTAKYTYKTKKGKITERKSTYKWSDGGSYESKTEYTKWKKVSHVRNVDGFWYNLPLG